MKNNNIRIGFIGCGNMARAIIDGLVANGYCDIIASDISQSQLDMANDVCKKVMSNQDVIDNSDYVILSIKPQMAAEALNGLDFSKAGVVPISIMAGITIDKIMAMTSSDRAVRVMPNLNAMVKMSYNAFCTHNLTMEQESAVTNILSSFGSCDKFVESEINAVTGIAGSGPAYVFMFFKGLIEQSKEQGLELKSAVNMVKTLLIGSATTISNTLLSGDVVDFNGAIDAIDNKVDSVCSKGGTTIEGVNHLNANDFVCVVSQAANKAIKRAEELSK